MIQRRTADSPLHGGRAPRWLFRRMEKLAGEILRLIVLEYGRGEVLRRLSDPWWFQAFGCVLGFDWHASGLTTVTCGAVKEACRRYGEQLGLVVAGGKGKASRRTPQEIEEASLSLGTPGGELVRISRLVAKIDSAAVQDGFQVYHHTFCFTAEGAWCVIQQGMNEETGYARRYHWLGEEIRHFTSDPHAGIVGARHPRRQSEPVLNLVAGEGQENREAQVLLSRLQPEQLENVLSAELVLPPGHGLRLTPFRSGTLRRILRNLAEADVAQYEDLLQVPSVGAKTLRALALVAEVVHGAPPSFRDPAIYTYAHGGKDGVPFPVDRDTYDRTIHMLREAVNKAEVGYYEKAKAFRRLSGFLGRQGGEGQLRFLSG